MEEILTNIGNYFSNFGNSLFNILLKIGDFFSSISDIIINVSSFIISIFGFIFHALKTLIVGVWNLIIYIVDSDVWFNSVRVLSYVSDFIGFPATMFILSILVLAIARILSSFVLKLIRGQDRYNTHQRKVAVQRQHDFLNSKVKSLFDDDDASWINDD